MDSHSCQTKVLVIGHSFDQRLDSFLQYIDGERNVMMLGAYRADKAPFKDKLIREWKLGTELGLDTEEFHVKDAVSLACGFTRGSPHVLRGGNHLLTLGNP